MSRDLFIHCADCRAGLMRLLVRPGGHWRVEANCPFCGGESYPTEVDGDFSYGGVGRAKEDDPTDEVASTRVEMDDTCGELVTFKVQKERPDARPVYDLG